MSESPATQFRVRSAIEERNEARAALNAAKDRLRAARAERDAAQVALASERARSLAIVIRVQRLAAARGTRNEAACWQALAALFLTEAE